MYMLTDVCWSHSSIDSWMGLAETVPPEIVTLRPDGLMRRTSKVETLTRTVTNYSACVPRNPCYKCGPTGCSTLVFRVFTETKNVPNHFLTQMSALLPFTPISDVSNPIIGEFATEYYRRTFDKGCNNLSVYRESHPI